MGFALGSRKARGSKGVQRAGGYMPLRHSISVMPRQAFGNVQGASKLQRTCCLSRQPGDRQRRQSSVNRDRARVCTPRLRSWILLGVCQTAHQRFQMLEARIRKLYWRTFRRRWIHGLACRRTSGPNLGVQNTKARSYS